MKQHLRRLISRIINIRPRLFNRTMGQRIITYFNGDAGQLTQKETGQLGFGLIHYAFITNTKPKRILCIGSRKGFVPAICALACADNNMGHVDFVDAGYDQDDKNHWSGIGWWKKISPHKHFSLFGINKWLTTYVMTTQRFATLYHRSYDYIYIDGNHSYKGVLLDYKLFWPRLTSGGLIVFHDAFVRSTKELGKFGVWKLWQQKAGDRGILFPFPPESGLGILQKR